MFEKFKNCHVETYKIEFEQFDQIQLINYFFTLCTQYAAKPQQSNFVLHSFFLFVGQFLFTASIF